MTSMFKDVIENSDNVSYRGPRSMVKVDTCQSTDGQYLGRCIRVVVECRSKSGRVSVVHWPLYRQHIDRSLKRSTDSRSR